MWRLDFKCFWIFCILNFNKTVYFTVKCDECGVTILKKNIPRHYKTIHRGIKDHQCHLCEKSYTTKQNLISHIKTHIRLRSSNVDVKTDGNFLRSLNSKFDQYFDPRIQTRMDYFDYKYKRFRWFHECTIQLLCWIDICLIWIFGQFLLWIFHSQKKWNWKFQMKNPKS